ncbi:MAG: HNH endonuclease [Bdellovibrionota bacterium]
MNLRHLPDEKILSLTKALVSEERETTTAILHYLAEIGRRKLYAKADCSSLFDFCVRVLGYSEQEAQRRISGSRVMKENPEIEKKIENGALSLSAIAQAQIFFRREESTPEQKTEILKRLEGQTIRTTEKILAGLARLPIIQRERVLARSENRFEVRLPISTELLEKLERLKSLWKLNTLEKVIEKMADQTIPRVDPTEKARRNAPIVQQVKITKRTRHIPAPVRHAVWLRDQGRCTYSQEGRTCNSTYDLELHHIKSYAKGGEHTVENLQLRCFTHNQLHAREEFGDHERAR